MVSIADRIKSRGCYFVALLAIIGWIFFIRIPIAGADGTGDSDNPLKNYENSTRAFQRFEIGNKIIYFHQRMIDGAIVEKDFINYQFDKKTKKLLCKKMHWRNDLPEHMATNITKAQAEAMTEGEVQFSQLYIISPESDVFPLEPTPKNPCWVVRSLKNGKPIVTIIDAVTGKPVGHGVSPPK